MQSFDEINFNDYLPMGKRLLIQRIESVKKTDGGLLLPEQAQEKQMIGIIKAISPELVYDELFNKLYKINKEVIFNKFAGTEIKIDNDNFIILKEEDILLVKI